MNSSPTYQNTMEFEDQSTPVRRSRTTIVWATTSPRSTPLRPPTRLTTTATGDTEDIDRFLHNYHKLQVGDCRYRKDRIRIRGRIC